MKVIVAKFGEKFIFRVAMSQSGHVVLALQGELNTELEDGREFKTGPGESYQVAAGAEVGRALTVGPRKRGILPLSKRGSLRPDGTDRRWRHAHPLR